MTDFDVHAFEEYAGFARAWHSNSLDERGVSLEEARERDLIDEDETRLLWELLGELERDELLLQIPEWLAEDKTGFVDGGTPTEFVGRIARETDKAILFADSASARPLARLAHRIQSLGEGVENARGDVDRREWLEGRLREKRRAFDGREDTVGLGDEWIPKSQVIHAVRRG